MRVKPTRPLTQENDRFPPKTSGTQQKQNTGDFPLDFLQNFTIKLQIYSGFFVPRLHSSLDFTYSLKKPLYMSFSRNNESYSSKHKKSSCGASSNR